MKTKQRKVGIVGCGKVGMSYAFSLMHSGICDKLILIDIDRRRAWAEAEDLRHGLCHLGRITEVTAGDYHDLRDADIVLITAGVAQKEGEDRMALLERNAAVFEEVVGNIKDSGFGGIYLVATNPVDIMTRLCHDLSGADSRRVIGSGTILDSARLRVILSRFFAVDPKNVHAYVLGEHGESEFVPFSQASVGTKGIIDICREDPLRFPASYLEEAAKQTVNAAAEIIAAKGATCYGIATALGKLTDAILCDEQSIFTLSCRLNGEYGIEWVYIGVPCVVTREGVREIVTLSLDREEHELLLRSADYLDKMYQSLCPKPV